MYLKASPTPGRCGGSRLVVRGRKPIPIKGFMAGLSIDRAMMWRAPHHGMRLGCRDPPRRASRTAPWAPPRGIPWASILAVPAQDPPLGGAIAFLARLDHAVALLPCHPQPWPALRWALGTRASRPVMAGGDGGTFSRSCLYSFVVEGDVSGASHPATFNRTGRGEKISQNGINSLLTNKKSGNHLI